MWLYGMYRDNFVRARGVMAGEIPRWKVAQYAFFTIYEYFVILTPPQLPMQPNTIPLEESDCLVNLCRQQQ